MKQRYVKTDKRIYSDPSVVHLTELHREISQDPEEIIRHLARNEVADARNYGWSGPPFDPRILASIIGIQCEKLKKLIHSEDAELHPIGNKDLIIRYNPNKPIKRQNFSIAHEIAHTLFPEYRNQDKVHHKIGRFNPEREVEFLCDLGASEIIMPTPEFDLDVNNMGISMKTLVKLSSCYRASVEATAIRMVTSNLAPCAMMILAYSHKPTELDKIEREKNQLKLFNDCLWEQPPMKLRVRYSFRSKNFSTYIPQHKSFEESSPFHKASVTRKPFQGKTNPNLTKHSLEVYAEAMALPGTHKPDLGSKVLVLLFQHQ